MKNKKLYAPPLYMGLKLEEYENELIKEVRSNIRDYQKITLKLYLSLVKYYRPNDFINIEDRRNLLEMNINKDNINETIIIERHKFTLFHIAVIHYDIEIMKILAKTGANIEKRITFIKDNRFKYRGFNSIEIVYNNYLNNYYSNYVNRTIYIVTLKFLIDLGANVNARNRSGKTILFMVPWQGFNIEGLKSLVEYGGADINIRDYDNNSILKNIIKRYPAASSKIVEYLLNKNIDFTVANKYGENILSWLGHIKRDIPQYENKILITKMLIVCGLNIRSTTLYHCNIRYKKNNYVFLSDETAKQIRIFKRNRKENGSEYTQLQEKFLPRITKKILKYVLPFFIIRRHKLENHPKATEFYQLFHGPIFENILAKLTELYVREPKNIYITDENLSRINDNLLDRIDNKEKILSKIDRKNPKPKIDKIR